MRVYSYVPMQISRKTKITSKNHQTEYSWALCLHILLNSYRSQVSNILLGGLIRAHSWSLKFGAHMPVLFANICMYKQREGGHEYWPATGNIYKGIFSQPLQRHCHSICEGTVHDHSQTLKSDEAKWFPKLIHIHLYKTVLYIVNKQVFP